MTDKRSRMDAEGLVRVGDKSPYVVLFKDDERVAQISMSEARFLANKLLEVCDKTEASASWLREVVEADDAAAQEGS